MLKTAIIDAPECLPSIRAAWEQLGSEPGATMFQSYAWNQTALNVFRDRESPRVVVVENDAGIALLPCVISNSCRTLQLAGEALFDYRNALVHGDEKILQHGWEIVAGWGMEFEAKALLGEHGRERWSGLPVEFFANAPGVRAGALSAEQFLGSHGRLGRHARRIRRQGAQLRRHPGGNRALVSLIYDLKAEQDVAGNLFCDPRRRQFMVEIAAHPASHCEIFTYETPGCLVAALLTFRDRSVRRCYTTYFDQRWAHFSPGQLLLFEVVAESLREGLDCDFMTGEYPYKNRIATAMVPLYRLRAGAEQLRAAARQQAPERPPLAA